MKTIDFKQLNTQLSIIKKKLRLEIDETILIQTLSKLSSEIERLKREKEYLEKNKQLIEILMSDYQYILGTNKFNIIKLKKEIEANIKENIQQIMYKSQKYDSNKILLDFVTNENLN